MAKVSRNNSKSPPKHPRRVMVWMVISQVIGLISLIPWLFTLMVAPPSAWFYPVLPIGMAIGAWILLAQKKYKAAIIITSLPLLLAVPALGCAAFSWLIYSFSGG